MHYLIVFTINSISSNLFCLSKHPNHTNKMPRSQKFVGVWVNPESCGFLLTCAQMQNQQNAEREAEREAKTARREYFRSRAANSTQLQRPRGQTVGSEESSVSSRGSRSTGSVSSSSSASAPLDVDQFRRERNVRGRQSAGLNRNGQPK